MSSGDEKGSKLANCLQRHHLVEEEIGTQISKHDRPWQCANITSHSVVNSYTFRVMAHRLFCTAIRAAPNGRVRAQAQLDLCRPYSFTKTSSSTRNFARKRARVESRSETAYKIAKKLFHRQRSLVSVAFLDGDGSKEVGNLTADAVVSRFALLKDARDMRCERGQYAGNRVVNTVRLSSEEDLKEWYTLDDQHQIIGTGTYGTVLSAVCNRTKQKVAIKGMEKKEQPHYAREIDMLKRVNSKGCVRLLEVMETDAKVFLVTELLRGGDLFDYIVDNNVYLGNMTVEQVLMLTRAMLCSLEACHLRNFAHLDVKPENFVFRHGAEKNLTDLVLVDFGAAQPFRLRPFARDRDQYQLGMDDYWIGIPESHIGGTASYVSPEVVIDGRFSSRSDMWSMGVTLYMMLTGQRPFEVDYTDSPSTYNAEKEIQSKIKVEAERARNQSIFRTCKDLENVHPGTKRLLEEMTQPDPAMRPSTTEAIHYIDKLLRAI